MTEINKFNTIKTAFISHAIIPENSNSEKSEKSFKLFSPPTEKKNGALKILNIAYSDMQAY